MEALHLRFTLTRKHKYPDPQEEDLGVESGQQSRGSDSISVGILTVRNEAVFSVI